MRASVPLLLTAISLFTPLRAQEPSRVLSEVQRQFEALSRHRDLPNVRLADRSLERLAALVDAPSTLREDACVFLERILEDEDGSDFVYRLRATAIRLIALLSDHPARTEHLLALLAKARTPGFDGLDHFVERALGHSRGKNQVRVLFDRLVDPDPVVLRTVVGGLARLADPKLAPLLASQTGVFVELTRHKDAAIRARAATVLGRIRDDSVLGVLFHLGDDTDALVRMAAAAALGGRLDRPGVDARLGRMLVDPSARVREAVVVAFRHAKDKASAPLLVARLAKEPLRIRAAIAETLKELTGLDFGAEPAPWIEWLRSARAAGGPILGDRAIGITPSRYAASYYGLPILSDRMVFVLDVSGSMGFQTGSRGGPTRLEIAKSELIKTLQSLDSRSDFNIVTFSSSVRTWKKRTLVRAEKANVAEAVAFVQSQEANGGTNSYGALEEVFEEFKDIDTIYFLSDGSPTVGKTAVHERIVQTVEKWNRQRGVRIHTIALLSGDAPSPFLAAQDDKDDAERFMSALAAETGGTFLTRR